MSTDRAPRLLAVLLATALPASSQAAPPAVAPTPAFLAPGLKAGKNACLGIAKNGRQALFLDEGKVVLLKLSDKAEAAEITSTWPLAGFSDALRANADLARTIADAHLVACRDSTAKNGGVLVAKSVPVMVTGSIDVAIDGNVPVHLNTQHESFSDDLEDVYWADDVGPIIVVTNNEVGNRSFIPIAPTLLGNPIGSCLQRPHGGKTASGEPPAFAIVAAKALPAVDPDAPADCIAMSKDGQHAAFRMWATNADDPDTIEIGSVKWFGTGASPDIDLGCVVAKGGCSAAASNKLTARARELGLTECAVASALVVDGEVMPASFSGNDVVVTTANGRATVWQAKFGITITSEYEALGKAYQHPRGGPLFLDVAVRVTPGVEARVYALGDKELGFCAPVPGMLAVAEVKSSSDATDGNGYHYGAKLVGDGDLGSAWQPAAPKAGDKGAPWVELTLAAPATVASVEIANGFQRKDGNGDMFTANARAATATLVFSDGSRESVTFKPDQRGLVRFDFAPRMTSSVRVTIDSQHAGARWPKDVALTEVRVFGPR